MERAVAQPFSTEVWERILLSDADFASSDESVFAATEGPIEKSEWIIVSAAEAPASSLPFPHMRPSSVRGEGAEDDIAVAASEVEESSSIGVREMLLVSDGDDAMFAAQAGLFETLTMMGFSELQAKEAQRRHSTVSACAAWILERHWVVEASVGSQWKRA